MHILVGNENSLYIRLEQILIKVFSRIYRGIKIVFVIDINKSKAKNRCKNVNICRFII